MADEDIFVNRPAQAGRCSKRNGNTDCLPCVCAPRSCSKTVLPGTYLHDEALVEIPDMPNFWRI